MARRPDGERGAALVEFGVCVPFLAIVICGSIDMGRAFEAQQQIKNAAREAALFGSRYPGRQVAGVGCVDPDTVTWHANNEGKSSFTVRVNNAVPTCNTGALPTTLQPGKPLKVTVSTSFRPFTPLAGRIFGDPYTVASSVCVNIAGATPSTTDPCP